MFGWVRSRATLGGIKLITPTGCKYYLKFIQKFEEMIRAFLTFLFQVSYYDQTDVASSMSLNPPSSPCSTND